VAFLKNRISSIFVLGIIIFAIIGIVSGLAENPAAFFKRIAVMILVGLTIYFLFNRFYKPSPERKEQKAFLRAAKRTKKKILRKKPVDGTRTQPLTKLTSIRKKSSAHLTVIEGKKNKKKNRASF
jgi:energy-coupling factor transporter transmembrane protein EcfT